MFAVGHIALGHITGKILGRTTGHDPSIPLLWTLSLLPDIDFLIPVIEHRGLTHSLLFAIIILSPFLIYKPRKAIPYFVALITHPLVGDFFTNDGVMLLWPFSTEMMRYQNSLTMGRLAEMNTELVLFTALILMLVASRDLKNMFKTENKNIILFVPFCTIVLPAMFKYPVRIPETLIIAHLILLGMIVLSITWSLIQKIKRNM